MKNTIIITLIIVVGFMIFALLYQPTSLKSETLENERFSIYFSPHSTIETILLDQQTGSSYLLVKDVEIGLVWNYIPTYKETHKIKY